MAEVAFLVYGGPDKQGFRKSASFDWLGNIGAYMVIDCLRRSGIEVGFCSPATAHEHKVVLASFTSSFDTYNFLRAVAKVPSWRTRKFRVIAGGFGLQNVYPIRKLIDYAVFGRCESFIAAMVQAALGGKDYTHESVMALENEVKEVVLGQAEGLYPHELDTQPIKYQEMEIGCPRRCLFCHYSFARKRLTSNKEMFRGALGWTSKEVLFDRLLQDSNMKGMTRTALDGFSERLRLAFHKPIPNRIVKETLEQISLKWQGKTAWLKLYQIGSMPTETGDDRREFVELINSCDCRGKRIRIDVHVTPFRPSALTPAGYLPVDLGYNWRRVTSTNIAKKPNLEVFYTPTIETCFAHLKELIVIRATEESDEILEAICFDRALEKLPAEGRPRALSKHFDLTPYLREYHTEEKLPTWYLSGHVPDEQVRALARKLKADLGMPELPAKTPGIPAKTPGAGQ